MRTWIWNTVRPTCLALLCLLFSTAAFAGSDLQAFTPDSFSRIASENKGKPFVLMVWSLDCTFCQKSMKTLAAERAKYKTLEVVTVSTDSIDDAQLSTLMHQRLAGLGLTNNAWAFGAAPPEQLRYAIDPKWRGEMPRTYWFNAHGEKVSYSGVLTPTNIQKLSAHALK